MVAPAAEAVIVSGIFGSVAGPAEEWSFRLMVRDYITNDQAKRQAFADAIATSWATNVRPLHPNTVHRTRVRVVALTDNGAGKHKYLKRADGSYVLADNLVTAQGSGVSSVVLPPQVAVTASLQTAAAGARGKGRVFLPFTVHPLAATDFRISETDALAIANGFRLFVQGINTAAGANQDTVNAVPRVCVYSGADNVLRPVTQVKVGRALDTMRSRRGDLPEGYSIANVA